MRHTTRKAPSTKYQAPGNSQIPSAKLDCSHCSPVRAWGFSPGVWSLAFAAFLLSPSQALATDAFYINDGVVSVVQPPQYAPQIDATNFVNNGIFNITNLNRAGLNPPLPFETWNTLNYSNRNRMTGDSGWRFDYYNSVSNRNLMAAQIAHKIFAVKRVIAKVNDPVRAQTYRQMGINTFSRTTILGTLLLALLMEDREVGEVLLRKSLAHEEELAHEPVKAR